VLAAQAVRSGSLSFSFLLILDEGGLREGWVKSAYYSLAAAAGPQWDAVWVPWRTFLEVMRDVESNRMGLSAIWQIFGAQGSNGRRASVAYNLGGLAWLEGSLSE
jgi:hypothetical protein